MPSMEQTYRLGLDAGSTTLKLALLDDGGHLVFSRYERHHAKVGETLAALLADAHAAVGDVRVVPHVTGSVGMGIAEACGLPFVQEVVAATQYIRRCHSSVATLIDIGGEDAKVVFFRDGEATDLRMNGNCAGGTGAFIDQMAVLLGVPVGQLDELARGARHIYPIASRCGVFSKTDIQNLIAKNAGRADIAASIFHAVAVQTVVTLAHGCNIAAPLLFCGGPLTFLGALRKAFTDYLHLSPTDIILPENAHLIPAWGAALSADPAPATSLSALAALTQARPAAAGATTAGLPPIFDDEDDHRRWCRRIGSGSIGERPLRPGREEVTLGIDSGSTTTKVVMLNSRDEIVFSYYHPNEGDPVAAVERGLTLFAEACDRAGTDAVITGSCSTGYGEDLIKAAFRLDDGIIETIAHYTAARHLCPDVSFILDIGGQDMKALFVHDGVINRVEINEACSSGCGSFIETFARSLGYDAAAFAREACLARRPYDLGTRCTVFMNSKVKQALREGATLRDIAAGLSYSVVKNCLYKVLRLKNTDELGPHVVVQGGTMKNDSVVRAFERLTGREVTRSSRPELMGAVGCALHARRFAREGVRPRDLTARSACESVQRQCHGCENRCAVTVYRFAGGNRYYAGNRCEKVFSNKGSEHRPGRNAYDEKLHLLFDRTADVARPRAVVGIPRCLNMYEEYPFWHTLLTRCGLRVVLSRPSSMAAYEASARLVMSDNICFPAKLVHSHIRDLAERGVDRVFMPFVVYEKPEGGANSYNCPIVTGYSEVVRNVQGGDVPVDSPVVTFKDRRLLFRQCRTYLTGLGVPAAEVKTAFRAALAEDERFRDALVETNRTILHDSRSRGELTVLLAGRPYHTDPLIQHRLSEMVAGLGVNVVTDDLVRAEDVRTDDAHYVPQWAYANRILRAAKWVALQGPDVQCMQMTSFGCGPDAFLTDETRQLLARHGKTLTLLKIDDVSNTGSIRLRVRSAVESLRLALPHSAQAAVAPFATTPPFGRADRRRKIVAPFFTPFFSPLVPALMRLAGYDVDNLPPSDAQSAEWGLRYANNEVCYPATLIVGDVVKAFKTGRYDPSTTAVAITQTGGQCRASNYIELIKRALTEAGYGGVPVVSVTFGETLGNEQPGFGINWFRLVPTVLGALLFSDSIAKLYYATAVREREPGLARRLKDRYLAEAAGAVVRHEAGSLPLLLERAAADFAAASTGRPAPRVGVVGEIFLKFNPFAQKDICGWLTEHGIEVVPPLLTDFFLQAFVNFEVNRRSGLTRRSWPIALVRRLYGLVWKQMERYNRAGRRHPGFTPFNDVYAEAAEARSVISLNAQFGEGWLLPAEVLSLARQGVDHVVSLQPFGCIANHIVAKGVEKRIKELHPDIHFLSLDFDSGVSDVNVLNRLLLFAHSLKEPA